MLDIFVFYLLILKYLMAILMVVMVICGLDDLIIDVSYWSRRYWREKTVYKKFDRKTAQELYAKEEKPLAIMVPAWQEHGVIAKMAELAATRLDYENYQIFVGTYPNDPETQNDVDEICAHYPNVHKVICARPGPTSKADCLNNIIISILDFEKRAKFEFEGFILHDSEDIISSMELRLFNHLLPSKDLIQLPVYPYTRKWYQWTSGHYADEFAELHGKDVVVREAIAGQVPSAGVGTCFSRRAILRLSVEGDGLPFDVQSLTEDYDIGFRLKQWGMNEIFVRFSVLDPAQNTLKENAFGVSAQEGSVVCVREYFPQTFSTAVRQKSRWIIGIVFQGFKNHQWTSDWKINYFLWRDRRGVISNAVSFLSMVVFSQLIILLSYSYLVSDGYHFLSLTGDSTFVQAILLINLLFMINRICQRFYFVSKYYGYAEGGLSILRLAWGVIINFAANIRAIRQVVAFGDPRRVAWDKTSHDFPVVSFTKRKTPLGSFLVEHNYLSSSQLEECLVTKPDNMLIGMYLVNRGIISNCQLSRAIAFRCQTEYIDTDPFLLDQDLIDELPKDLALKYSILPIAKDQNTLIIGKESALTPIAFAAIQRRIKKPVRWVVTTNGAVTLGIHYWYLENKEVNPYPKLEQITRQTDLEPTLVNKILDIYFSSYCQLGTWLLSARLIDPAVLNQAILAFEKVDDMSFGKFLIERGYVKANAIDKALTLQKRYQRSIKELAHRFKPSNEGGLIAELT